ncbi:Pectinesterase [Bertholletia excelsa]
MESINFIKGYGKVDQLEDQSPINYNKRPGKPLIAVIISLIVLLTVVIGVMVGALIYESNTEPPESSSESIRAVCSVTQYPDSCFTSITSSLSNSKHNLGSFKPHPEMILKHSIWVARDEVETVCPVPKMMMGRCMDRRSESAMSDCVSLFGDSLSRLNESVTAIGGEEELTEAKIGDLKTWISSAMTDQETCMDGLKEMGSTTVDEVRTKVQRSKEYMSNSLAILSSYKTVLGKFDLKMH